MNPSLTALFEQIVTEVLDDLFAQDPDVIHDFLDPDAPLPMWHMTTGRYIRNHYNLWTNNTLQELNIHPDDFSGDCIDEIQKRGQIRYKQQIFNK